MIRTILIPLALSFASPALAAGGAPTTPTQTTQDCARGEVWDAEAKACVPIRDSRMDDPTRLEAATELAAFDRAGDAAILLAGLSDPDTPDALTVRGFAERKAGDLQAGLALYGAALRKAPDHWQARAYLGEALLERGDRAGAEAQLAAIRASGGRGAWPEVALARLLDGGGSIYR